MHYDDSPMHEWSIADEDEMIETAVLLSVLDLHPTQLTIAEVTRELTLDSECFGEGDRVERAIQRLVGVGLLRRHGEAVVATRAAQYFKALELV